MQLSGMCKTSAASFPFFILIACCAISQVGAAAPAAPDDVKVEYVTRSEISLVWTRPAGALRFKAEYRKAGSASYESYGPGATFTQPSLVVGLLPVNVSALQCCNPTLLRS